MCVQILPTSQDMVLDPKVLMLWSVQLNFTGTSASGNLLQLGTSDGLRALPATAAIGTGQIQILVNGSLTATVQPDCKSRSHTLTHTHTQMSTRSPCTASNTKKPTAA